MGELKAIDEENLRSHFKAIYSLDPPQIFLERNLDLQYIHDQNLTQGIQRVFNFPKDTPIEALDLFKTTSDTNEALDKLHRNPELFSKFVEVAVKDQSWVKSNENTLENMIFKLNALSSKGEMQPDQLQAIEKTMQSAAKALGSDKVLPTAEVITPNQLAPSSAENPVIILICNPRTVSTAFEKSFMQRGDFSIIHEPYLQCWANRDSGEKSFSEHDEDLFDKTMSNEELKNYIFSASRKGPVFIKDMVLGIYEPLMSDDTLILDPNVRFAFLIRDPAKVLLSYYEKLSKNLPDFISYIPTVQRFDWQLELIEKIQKLRGEMPTIIDADDLVQNPSKIMNGFCETNNIEFKEDALSWEPGFDESWKPWAEFHDVVSKSTSFKPTRTETDFSVIPAKHREMIETHYRKQLLSYQKMYERRLK